MIWGPRIRSSPDWRAPSAAPVTRSTIFTSVFGTTLPIDPGFDGAPTVGLRWVTGLASVMPYPWTTGQPSFCPSARAISSPSGAAPENTRRTLERSNCATAGCFTSPRTMGGTSGRTVTRCFWTRPRNSTRSKRGIVTTVLPLARHSFMMTTRP